MSDASPRANIWQGAFPDRNDRTEWIESTSPVGSFEPNGYGLFDAAGNVEKWNEDSIGPTLTPSVPTVQCPRIRSAQMVHGGRAASSRHSAISAAGRCLVISSTAR
ncbi:MAG: SUMF1/EgtB/PvdO family nonheme iron enzyme, partial [Planctomycetota bacterium]